MKYAAIFALFAIAFVVAVSAADDEDVCGLESFAHNHCSKSANPNVCAVCLIEKCHPIALKDGTECPEILGCIDNSGCNH